MRRRSMFALGCVAALVLGTTGGGPVAATSTSALSEQVRHVFHDGSTTGGHVTVQGDRLYLGAYGLGFRIFDISDPVAPREIGSYLPGGRADAVPDAAVFDGRHIAVLNGTRRVSSRPPAEGTDISEFLDVTDPANPRLLWKFVGQEHGEAHNGDIVDQRRLWLPSGGSAENGLRVYDLNPLLGTEPAAPAQLTRANPVELWEASPFRGGRHVGPDFTHTHDISAYPDYPLRQPDGTVTPRDILLLAEGGNYSDDGPDYGAEHGNTGSVFVIDATDPANPVVLNRWLHERGPGHHPIRYTHEAQFLDGDPRLMLVTDEDMHHPCGAGDGAAIDTAGGGVTAVRLSDTLTSATEESEWFIPAGTPAPVCSVHVMSSKSHYLLLGSYNAGLQVVDDRDPTTPKQAGYGIQPGATSWGAQVHKQGVVYVGDMTRGLDVFVFEPLVPRGRRT
ncbi:MAG: LVIVD repeat-containing protein [Micromonosporaceae bacterium]